MSITTDTNKRYYWLKLSEDFFKQKEIKQLRRMAGGDTFTIIYLKMLLRSLKDGGRLYYEGIEQDFVSELALDIDEDVENVKLTVAYLISKSILIQGSTDDEYELLTADEMTGSETASTRRSRKSRASNKLISDAKLLQCNTNATKCNTDIEIDIDKEKRANSKTPQPDGFDDFWKEYPRKEDKSKARIAWKNLKPNPDLRKTIIEDVRDRCKTDWKDKDKRYSLLPTTYIHNKRWEDERGGGKSPAQDTDQHLKTWDQMTPEEQSAAMNSAPYGKFY